MLVDQFLKSFDSPPARITLDRDAFDAPCHGQQQLVMFHGDDEQYRYLPIAITCAENDAVVLVGLRFGTCAAFLGAEDDLRSLTERLRAVWPDLKIIVRADCGFGVPLMYDVCRELRLTYTFRVPACGCGMNAVLKRESQALQDEAVARYEQTGQPQRRFLSLRYQAGTWAKPQRVIIKCAAHAQGTNRRAVVTNRPGAEVLSQPVYDEYTERGESENRNTELKCGLCADRLSDHRFLANFFRLYLHTSALNLLVRLRRTVARKFTPHERSESGDRPTHLPAEALAGSDRRRFLQRHRDCDPLGEGHVATWRTRLIKVAAQVLVRARRIVIRLSASWPHQDHFAAVSRAVTRFATG